MMDFFKKNKLPLVFGGLGALGGFLYWKFVGCVSGTCMIQSVWYWSTLWGMAVGYLIGDMIRDFMLKRANKKNEREV
ncbi:hypothetical protein BA6E_1103 [Bacteroidales bacterium 6E]|nr:hypothetical protein BA6E_1103 [Bacteroidales bacterium 6E]